MQRPAHARLEQKSKCRAEGGRQEWPERRALRGVEIGRSARNFGLPLETLEQVRRALHRLDRLDVAPAQLANAQEHAPLAEGKIGRIEIDRDQFLHAWRSPGPGSQKRVGLDLRGIGGSELKLELDLLRFPPRPSSDHHEPLRLRDTTSSTGKTPPGRRRKYWGAGANKAPNWRTRAYILVSQSSLFARSVGRRSLIEACMPDRCGAEA